MLNLITILLGAALLLAGRKLFWLFVGVIGFATGVQIAMRLFHGSELVTLVAGLVLGLVFAGLAVLFERLAILVAGFLAGGYLLFTLAVAFGIDRGPLTWAAFLVGGVLGALLVGALFDWALISISALTGAAMIMQALHLAVGAGAVGYILLVIVGVAFQGMLLRRERQAPQQTHARSA
jgi:hypothetical protein